MLLRSTTAILTALALLASGCFFAAQREREAPRAGKPGGAGPRVSPDSFNLIFLRYYRDADRRLVRIFPFFSTAQDLARRRRELIIWPLLSGYTTSPTADLWFSLPLLTFSGSSGSSGEQHQAFVSVPLLTLSHRWSGPGGRSHLWISLPLFSLFTDKEVRREHSSWTESFVGNPWVHMWRVHHDRREPGKSSATRHEASRWTFLPVNLRRDYDAFFLQSLSRPAGRGMVFARVFDFDLFSYERWRAGSSPFPWGIPFSVDWDGFAWEGKGTEVRRLGFLDPLITVTSEGEGGFSLLPLFSDDGKEVVFLPLMLAFGKRVRFAPEMAVRRMWPLVYHDERDHRWDILWPLLSLFDPPGRHRVRLRLLFDLDRTPTATRLDLGEGLLLSYVDDGKENRFGLLGGFLFERSSTSDTLRWSFGRGFLFGRERSPKGDFLVLMFVKIRIGS